jgi:catechol 2,3-dioxygenase-like lactoylglutathione lyase family enzyme
MAKIKHLAIKTRDPNELATFYENTLGLEVVLRRETGAVYMSDGYLSLALLPMREGDTHEGLDHFGFAIDDLQDVANKLNAAGVMAPKVRPNNPPFAETRAIDPHGNEFDLSVHGFERVEYQEDRAEKKEKIPEPA